MASYPHDLKYYLSGGAANSDPSLSIGGAISSTQLLSQSITTSTHAGITYSYVGGCVAGAGVVRFTLTGTLLDFLGPNRSVYGPAVNVNTNGTYTIRDDALVGTLVVTKSGSLPAGNASQNVTIGQNMNLLFDDVSKAEALAGRTEYRCIYVKNTSGSDALSTVKLWVESEPSGPDTIEIGLDPGGKNSTPSTITNDTTAPANVSFYPALGEANALSIGTLNTSDYYPVWIKRIVAATTDTVAASDLSQLRATFL